MGQGILGFPTSSEERQADWTIYRKGLVSEAVRRVTLTGAAQEITIDVVGAFKIHRVVLKANDATAKTFNIRVHHGIYVGDYEQVDSQTANTDISYTFGIVEGLIFLSARQIQFNFSDTTLNKTVDIHIFILDIPEATV